MGSIPLNSPELARNICLVAELTNRAPSEFLLKAPSSGRLPIHVRTSSNMTEFRSPADPLPAIPDNLSIPQFFLDCQHPVRPLRKEGIPWLIEDQGGREIGYEELRARTFGLANALRIRWNIGENDVVCILSTNSVDYPVAIWAVHRLGGVISPANPAYCTDELAHQLTTTKARLLLAHPDFSSTALAAARIAGIPPENLVLFDVPSNPISTHLHSGIDELVLSGLSQPPNFVEKQFSPGEAKNKVAFLSFSSGTTGKPKAVVIPHYSVIVNVIQMAVHINDSRKRWNDMRIRPGDRAAAVLPFFHIYGLIVNMHFMLFSGVSLVVTSKFNFVEFLKSIVRHRITHIFLVPPQVVLFCKHPSVKNYNLDHIRFCMIGAAPLSVELTKNFAKVLPKCSIGQGYGLTESATTISAMPAWQGICTIGSAGQLLPGIRARVVKRDGSLARYGEQGELFVAGPAIALGYLNNQEATKETFVDGWLRTGDEVIINENAEIFIVDRLKEIMKVRGFQVAPAELEGHLLGHPAVADVGVVSVPDEYSGEVPLAFVVLDKKAVKRIEKDPQEAERIKASIAKHVSDAKVHYKWLAGGVEFTDNIPKNPSGKILRRILREKVKTRKPSPINLTTRL